ncbi:copper chaperone NosL [Halospina denitrificans]|uniref:Copper chaperone NosL n=1 Tax=Halospina denitrificans TaxID=332522 RepID=A0A4R7JQI2_9GAMM|nr:nitrous oxide reductase accessory protein NosL [Halospina denitrificans]TDT40175.1 copper chaperone NosL [Halospina denitrificans]
MTTRREIIAFIGALPILSLAGCGPGDDSAASCKPIVLGDDRECALCGMTISNFPGPKGQACLDSDETKGFCSTNDLFSWAWQPESKPRISALYVHDLSRTGWQDPGNEDWMDARDAIYVINHDQEGAMGHSPAPFSKREDAEAFASDHGGQVLAFEDLDWDALKTPS